MASDRETIERIAEAISDKLWNSGQIVDIYTARDALSAESGADLFWCQSCGAELDRSSVTQKRCPECSGRQATTKPPYTCVDCGRPVSLGMSECPSCHSRGASKTAAVNPAASQFECLRCGRGVSREQSSCTCGETRCVRRGKSGTPITTIES